MSKFDTEFGMRFGDRGPGTPLAPASRTLAQARFARLVSAFSQLPRAAQPRAPEIEYGEIGWDL